MKKIKTLVAFSTTWGTRFGGINSFNYDLLRGLSGVAFNNVETICVVTKATPSEIEDAARDQITLVSTNSESDGKFPISLEPSVWEALGAAGIAPDPNQTIWLGHDRITGAIALEAARKRGGRAALIHHMSYATYEAYSENSILANQKKEEQRQLFNKADIVLAVGPLLRDALADMLDRDLVPMLVPGLPDIEVRRAPRTFRAFLSGRLSDDAKKIKQAHLGLAAFADAIRQADENVVLPDMLRGAREPSLILRGVDFEQNSNEKAGSAELELKRFAEQYAGRAIAMHALPFTTEREVLFADLASSSVAMMPSWHEGFGLVAWEAIGAGVPLVVSIKSGVYRLLSEIDFGIYCGLVMPLDVLGSNVEPFFLEKDKLLLTQGIIQIAKDPAEWKRKALRLREELASKYTWAVCAKNLLSAIGWTLDEPMFMPVQADHSSTAIEKAVSGFDILEMPVSTWKIDAGLSESQLLRAEEAVLPFHPNREPFLQEQIDWAVSSVFPVSVRLITGPGGAGKTRLALQLSERLIASGWKGGFLRGDCDVGQATELGKKLASLDCDSCIIVDYAETRQRVLLAVLRAILVGQSRHHVRVLLLARSGGDWWDLLPSKDSACQSLLEGTASTGPFQMPDLHDQDLDRQSAYQLALQKFAEKLRLPVPDHTPQLHESHFSHPLYIQMAALMALKGERPKSAEALTRALVGHERRYWRNTLADINTSQDLIEEQAALLMALSTLVGGISTTREVESIWIECGGQKELLKPLFKALAPLYPGRQGLEGWRPDLLGEALIGQVLLADGGSAFLDAILGQNSQQMRQSGLTVLARMLMNRPQLSDLIEDALVEEFQKCADDIVSVTIETSSVLPSIAERAFERLPRQIKWQVAGVLRRHLHYEVLPLTGLDVLVSKVLVEKAERALVKGGDEAKSNYAEALSNLSVALNRDGKTVEAWEVVSRAVTIFRQLAINKPELYEKDLAASLDLYAGYSNSLQRVELALSSGQEALLMHRRFAKANPQKFESELAHSLTNYAAFLSSNGQDKEAFNASKEALALLEKLMRSQPALYESSYLNAVGNYAIRLQEQGESDEAVRLGEQGVKLGRKLAAEKPERYEYTLALVLSNLGSILINAGKGEQAILVAEEALQLRRRLALAKPVRFNPDLATSLSNYAAHLAEQGKPNEAIRYNEEALLLRKHLCDAEPGRYEDDLATSYSNFGVHLAEKGRFEDAAVADQHALVLRERLAEAKPYRFEADLAMSLSNLAGHMADLGNWDEAVALQSRSLSLYERCALRNPNLYVYKRESCALVMERWTWLKEGKPPILAEQPQEVLLNLNSRDMAALAFERASLAGFVMSRAASLSVALNFWKALDASYQYAFARNYLAIGLLAKNFSCPELDVEAWRKFFDNYKRETSERFPHWVVEILKRAKCETMLAE